MRPSQSVTFTPYRIRVKKRGKDEYCVLDKLPDGQFLFHVFRTFLDTHNFGPDGPQLRADGGTATVTVDNEDQTAFRVFNMQTTGSPTTTEVQTIEAVIELGSYGLATKLYDIVTETERAKLRSEADLAPFYVRLDVHNGTDSAILLIQEFGRQHARGVFTKKLKEHFGSNVDYTGYHVVVETLVTAEYLESITSGGIKSIRCFRKMTSKDVSDRLVADLKEGLGTVEVIVRSPLRQRFSMKVKEAIDSLTGNVPAGQLIAVEDGPEYERFKIEIDYRGRRRTINLNRRQGLLPYMAMDVTDELKFDDETNHPTFESLRRVSQELVKEMSSELGWKCVPQN